MALAQAARDLDLHETVLRSWIRELATDPQQAFPGKGVMKPEQAELDRLRKEVAKLKMERDILKKAAAYFVGPANSRNPLFYNDFRVISDGRILPNSIQ